MFSLIPLPSFLHTRWTLLATGVFLLAIAGCGEAPTYEVNGVRVHNIRIDSTGVGVIENAAGRILLVDIGLEGAYAQLLPRLEERGLSAANIATAVITHAHGDHAGDVPALQAAGIEVWVHEDDKEHLAEGINGETVVYGPEASFLEPFVTGPYPPSVADEFLTGEQRIVDEFDVVIDHVGGHTAGSLTVVVGGKYAFLGDLIRGGSLGGTIAPEVPNVHYFHEDIDQSHQALADILVQYPDVETFFPAHGGPFTKAQIEGFLEEQGL